MLQLLPPQFDFDNPELLKQTVAAARALGELKGAIATIPNERILLDTLIMSEAQSSSAIENIITTHNELYIANIDERNISPSTKEVKNYAEAVKYGHRLIKQNELLTINNIIAIQKVHAPNHGEIRKIPGTVLKNDQTGQTVYTPPQDYDEIIRLLRNLEAFINDPTFSDLDPLIKMAIIHYQFESIHPFHDGNGRMGRMLNILYLTQQKLLSLPVLYLSQYIIEHKNDYYALLQAVRDADGWLAWCVWLIRGVEETAFGTIVKIDLYLSQYIIEHKNDYYALLQAVRDADGWLAWCVWLIRGVEETAFGTIVKIDQIKSLMQQYKTDIREQYKFYSQDLINVLFQYPYTKIEFLEKELSIHRNTATKYLEQLSEGKFLSKIKLGRDNFYFNTPLFDVLIGNHPDT